MDNNGVIVKNVVRVPAGQHYRVSTIHIVDGGRELHFVIINGEAILTSVKLPYCHRLDNRDLNPGRRVEETVAAILREKRRVK